MPLTPPGVWAVLGLLASTSLVDAVAVPAPSLDSPPVSATANVSQASSPPGTTAAPAPNPFTWTGADRSYVESVLSCQSLKDEWSTASSSWNTASHSSYSYSTYIAYATEWAGNYSGLISTLCDGVPRATGSAPLITTPTYTQVATNAPPFPTPAPSCTYNYHGCELLISSYRSATSSASAVSNTDILPSLKYPSCWNDKELCINPAGEGACRLDAGDVKLIYWASTKNPSAICTGSNTAPTKTKDARAQPPSTVVSGTYTFTSPTVYLSFSALYGLGCYKTWPNAIIPVPSTSLSSIAFGTAVPIYRTVSMNWADLASPVPLSAYSAQMSCQANWGGARAKPTGDGCSTIYDDYLPWLALPTNPALFTDLDPRFANCSGLNWRKYVFDPPLALTAASDLDPETSSTAAASAAALPTAPASAVAGKTTAAAVQPVTAATIGASHVAVADPRDPANVLVDGTLMLPGQVTVVDSTPVVVATGAVVVGGSTTVPLSPVTPVPVATVASQVIYANPGGSAVVVGGGGGVLGGQVLSPGEVDVVGGVTVSVGSSAVVVGGSKTYTMPKATAQSTSDSDGLGAASSVPAAGWGDASAAAASRTASKKSGAGNALKDGLVDARGLGVLVLTVVLLL